jgi:hypothetical protein
MTSQWRPLDISKAESLLDLLSYGKSVGVALAEKLKNNDFAGIEALVPEDITEEQLYNFYDASVSLQNRNYFLESFLRNELAADENRMLVFANSMAEKDDRWIQKIKLPYFIYGKDVYHFYNEESAKKYRLDGMIKWVDIYPHICVVLNQTFNFDINENVTDDKMNDILASMETAFVGVYDEESFVKIRLK